MGGVAYSAGRAVQEVGQEAGNIARKNPANCAADVLSRARRRSSMSVWTCSLRETQRQSHTDAQRHALRLSLSQLQPGIVRVRVAKGYYGSGMDALNRMYEDHGCYYGTGMDALNRTYEDHGCYYGSGMDAQSNV